MKDSRGSVEGTIFIVADSEGPTKVTCICSEVKSVQLLSRDTKRKIGIASVIHSLGSPCQNDVNEFRTHLIKNVTNASTRT